MTVAQLAVVTGAVLVASFIQAIAAFGFGLLSVPLMTLAIAPKRAVVISTLVGILITAWQAWYLRRDTDRALARRLIVAAYVGMPVGLVVLSTFGDNLLRLLLGTFVLLAVVVLARGITWAHDDRLDLVGGFLSGVLNTALSTNGPPLVFVMQSRNLSPVTFRATIAFVFAVSNVGALALFLGTGKVTSDGLRATALAIPALAIGQVAGFPIRKHLDATRFRRLVLAMLTLAGIAAIVAAVR